MSKQNKKIVSLLLMMLVIVSTVCYKGAIGFAGDSDLEENQNIVEEINSEEQPLEEENLEEVSNDEIEETADSEIALEEKTESANIRNENVESEALKEDEEKKDEKIDAPILEMKKRVGGTEIYLNGAEGNDSNDGHSKEFPVKTFDRAKRIAIEEQDVETILVSGSTELEGNISLAGTNITVKREKDFSGELFTVAKDKEANLSEITIDGGGETVKDKKSLIKVLGTLVLNDGTVLKNNKIVNSTFTATTGGAIYARSAKVYMHGGKIETNQANYGGGIYLYNSMMDMDGGRIEHNRANILYDKNNNQYYAAGGGVLIEGGSTFNLSHEARISENRSDELGGGISIGANDWSDGKDRLNMTGGYVDGNKAGAAGGGIFIQMGIRERLSSADITAGTISNNVMDGKGVTQKTFGGGGIYVNGIVDEYADVKWTSGELHLKNVLISENSAVIAGGGYASCPTSNTHIYINDGAAIYKNEAGNARDIYILSHNHFGIHSGNPSYDISERMLGGNLYHWKDDNGVLVNKLQGILTGDGNSVNLHTDEVADDAVKRLAKVFIKGNVSVTRGGGIGSNGVVYIGEEGEHKEIEIIKTWADGLEMKPVEIQLRARIGELDWLVEKIILNEGNNFKHIVKNLPATIEGKKIEEILYVKESNSKDYIVDVSDIKVIEEGKKYQVIIENKKPPFIPPPFVPVEPLKLNIKVTKLWVDHVDNKIEPGLDEIKVELYKNGIKTGMSITLSEENQWTGMFEGLMVSETIGGLPINYTVREAGESYGIIKKGDDVYWVGYQGDSKHGFTIINKKEKPKIPTIDLKVKKVWQDSSGHIINPELNHIYVELIRDGISTGQVIKLDREHNWTGYFKNLIVTNGKDAKAVKYTVKEVGEHQGTVELGGETFEVSYAENLKDGITITNEKEIPKKPNRPHKNIPKTGNEFNRTLYLGLLGFSSIVLLYFLRKKKHS